MHGASADNNGDDVDDDDDDLNRRRNVTMQSQKADQQSQTMKSFFFLCELGSFDLNLLNLLPCSISDGKLWASDEIKANKLDFSVWDFMTWIRAVR